MRQTTEAIVLGLRKHSDKLSVLHVYTRSEGRLALHVYGAHGKHKVRAAYQPMTVVEITYENYPTHPRPTLSTIDPVYLPERIYDDMRRRSIALFVTEILLLNLTHPMQDDRMYQFIVDFVHELNDTSEPENIHIRFMQQFAKQLGIGSPLLGSPDHTATPPASRQARQQQLKQLCEYYMEHIEAFRMPKSLDILIEIFD